MHFHHIRRGLRRHPRQYLTQCFTPRFRQFIQRDMSSGTSSVYRVVKHTIDCHHTREYLAATANGDDDLPQLAVKQYIPRDNPTPGPGDVTIIGAHANGFPKVSLAWQTSAS